MAGMAAFDMVFQELNPGAPKVNEGVKQSSQVEDSLEKSIDEAKASLKWKPTMAELMDSQDFIGGPKSHDEVSWQSLLQNVARPGATVGKFEDEKQDDKPPALEYGQLALADGDPVDDETANRQKLEKRKAEPANSEGHGGKKSKAAKSDGERKSFANRVCPPGPEGSTRFKAIQSAYNKYIKTKICRNKESCFWDYCRSRWAKEPGTVELADYAELAEEYAQDWLRQDGQQWLAK